ncbi:molybdopterin-dependent oxidoreductase [Roseobacter sp. EG26]|uniref:molybdopterin-dependent oxidoreductase n=1 Tax=Roseobacter sp. EG26 TaxID=3412477 RepID=UPI003CE4FA8A
MNRPDRDLLTSSHWGTYSVDVVDGQVTGLRNFEHDPDPSPIGHGIVDVLEGPTRITAPMVRKSWLEGGPGTAGQKRGLEEFVEVSWQDVNKIVAAELNRVRQQHGNNAIYAGSYGWASAGRFHHAQSQLKRFLNCIGGFTSSKNTYSFAAAEVVVPHVLGTFRGFLDTTTSWESIATDCELLVAFGGIPLKNGQISQGGLGAHVQMAGLRAAKMAKVQFVNISPLKSDLIDDADAQWLALRPSTDAALMLSLAYEIFDQNLHDQSFLDHYTVGFDRFAAYLTGETDGIPKSAEWAARICDLPASEIQTLARRMATHRTMISVAWALTRQDHGEQPFWAAINLAAMLGQMGLPGAGISFGYSAMNNVGLNRYEIDYASFPQGQNPVEDFIPVARLTDMLENPGGTFTYDGASYTYPDIRLVWWAGGNPFHHHQDLNRLRRAWARPETIIANEWCWNALAKHADIVLPCTTTLERPDIAMSPKDPYIVSMDAAIEPVGRARDDYDIFSGIAAEMGVDRAFTEGRNTESWLRWLWDVSRQQAAKADVSLPNWETFQRQGWVKLPTPEEPTIMMEAFRADPQANPLRTPSGKIELFSQTVHEFAYDDCPGHPVWLEPAEWLGGAGTDEFHLISNQPRNKLHSQLDHGPVSCADRPKGVEPVTMHPTDAAMLNLAEGEVLRLSNERGTCLAELRTSKDIRRGVIQIATGAWFKPIGEACQNGNPNVLTLDKGTSQLAQGPVAHSCLVKVARQ